MARDFEELKRRLPEDVRERAERRTHGMLSEMPRRVSRDVAAVQGTGGHSR
ncbi:hypothetical protein [Salinisphaera sp. PC39]|uniref:hypothetical protein n=1 Tax=Salinisphaera sp. PC39 TaxID=1304156 RepID=UPI0033423FEB